MKSFREMRRHVARLARQLDVELSGAGSPGGANNSIDRQVRTSPVCGPITYATALHELGHQAYHDAREDNGQDYNKTIGLERGRAFWDGVTGNNTVLDEVKAWEWAMEQAHFSTTMRAYAYTCLSSYLAHVDKHTWPRLQRAGLVKFIHRLRHSWVVTGKKRMNHWDDQMAYEVNGTLPGFYVQRGQPLPEITEVERLLKKLREEDGYEADPDANADIW